MIYRNKATRRVSNDKVEYYCKCAVRLTVKTSTKMTNPGKRFVKCAVCQVHEFLDEDLPSEYYKKLVHGLLLKEKGMNKNMEVSQQVIHTIAFDKSIMGEELIDLKAKLKLYERLFFVMICSFALVCVGFGMILGK